MCSYLSTALTPYRIPLVPPSQCSYISDFNQSLASPSSRRINAMQKRQSIEADTNTRNDGSLIAGTNAAKVKYSMAILVILSLSSLLFTFFGLYILSIYLSFPFSYESASEYKCKIRYAKLISEVIVISAVISTMSSLTTFFVTAVQLIVMLQMLKRNPVALTRVVGYIHNGRLLRFGAYSGWILSFLLLIFGFALFLLLLCREIGFVPQVTGAAFGVFSLLACTINCLHTIYALWSRHYRSDNDNKDASKADFSTLV